MEIMGEEDFGEGCQFALISKGSSGWVLGKMTACSGCDSFLECF